MIEPLEGYTLRPTIFLEHFLGLIANFWFKSAYFYFSFIFPDLLSPQTLSLLSLVVQQTLDDLLLGDFSLRPLGVDLEGEIMYFWREGWLVGLDLPEGVGLLQNWLVGGELQMSILVDDELLMTLLGNIYLVFHR